MVPSTDEATVATVVICCSAVSLAKDPALNFHRNTVNDTWYDTLINLACTLLRDKPTSSHPNRNVQQYIPTRQQAPQSCKYKYDWAGEKTSSSADKRRKNPSMYLKPPKSTAVINLTSNQNNGASVATAAQPAATSGGRTLRARILQ